MDILNLYLIKIKSIFIFFTTFFLIISTAFGLIEEELIRATAENDVNKVAELLENEADPNHREKYSNTIPLMVAIKNRSLGIVEALLEAGADPNKTDEHKNKPLLWATQRQDLSIIQILIKAGANLEAKNNFGKTAWMIANDIYGGLVMKREDKDGIVSGQKKIAYNIKKTLERAIEEACAQSLSTNNS